MPLTVVCGVQCACVQAPPGTITLAGRPLLLEPVPAPGYPTPGYEMTRHQLGECVLLLPAAW